MWTLVPKKSTTPPANTSTVPWIDNHKVTYVPTDDRGEVFPDAAVKLQATVITEPEFSDTFPAAAVKLQAACRGLLVRLARRPIQVKYTCANARFVTKACVCPESANKGAKKTIKRRKRITKRLRFTSRQDTDRAAARIGGRRRCRRARAVSKSKCGGVQASAKVYRMGCGWVNLCCFHKASTTTRIK
jgi:hypothetical protein